MTDTYIEYRVEWRSSPRRNWRCWKYGQSLRAVADSCAEARADHQDLEFRVVERTVTSTEWTPTRGEAMGPQ